MRTQNVIPALQYKMALVLMKQAMHAKKDLSQKMGSTVRWMKKEKGSMLLPRKRTKANANLVLANEKRYLGTQRTL
jgi:hypothetical protein